MEKVIFKFTDDMFPAPETIETAVSKAGYKLDNNYTGNSYNPALVYIFNKLINEGNLNILESVGLEIPKNIENNLVKIFALRYNMQRREISILERISHGRNIFIENFNSFNSSNFNDINYAIAYIIGMNNNDKDSLGWKTTFDMIQVYWQEKYDTNSLAPFPFLENYINIKKLLSKKDLFFEWSLYASKHDGARTLNVSFLRNSVAASFMFSAETIYTLAMRGLTSEKIIAYVNSGIDSSKDILEWSENMPTEWAGILLTGVK